MRRSIFKGIAMSLLFLTMLSGSSTRANDNEPLIYCTDSYSNLGNDSFKGFTGKIAILCHIAPGFVNYDIELLNSTGEEVSLAKLKSKNEFVQSCKIEDVIIVKGKVWVIASGKNEAVSDDYTGVFAWEFNPETGDFKEPFLVAKFQEKPLSNLVISISENEEYVAFLADFHSVGATACHSHAAVVDSDLKPFYTLDNQEITVQHAYDLNKFFVSNNGDLFIASDQSTGGYDLNTYVQRPSLHGALFCNQNRGNLSVEEMSDEKVPLGYNFFELNGKTEVLYFWTSVSESNKVTMSLYDPESKKHTDIHTFDPMWLEAYLDVRTKETNLHDNTTEKRGDNQVSIFFDLVSVIETDEGYRTYIIQKYYPVMIVTADSHSQSTDKTYTTYSGDILILEFDQTTGELRNKSKIERSVHSMYASKGLYCKLIDRTLSMIYYSKDLSNIPADAPSNETNLKNRPDLNLRYSSYHIDTHELVTKNVSLPEPTSSGLLTILQLDHTHQMDNNIAGIYTMNLKVSQFAGKMVVNGSTRTITTLDIAKIPTED